MTGFRMPAPTREEMRLGILFVGASIFLVALVTAIVKWLSARSSSAMPSGATLSILHRESVRQAAKPALAPSRHH